MTARLLEILFTRLGVNYTPHWLSEQVAISPYMESMYGLGTMLSRYNVGNECVRFDDKSALHSARKPCVVVFGHTFAIVTGADADFVTMTIAADKGEPRDVKVPWGDFAREWSGVAMLVTADANSGEPDYAAHRRAGRLARFKRLALTGGVAVAVSLALLTNPLTSWWAWWLLLVVNAAGMGVAYMLLQKQLHIPNRLADGLCSLARESHCEEVTESDGASLLGLVKLSEVGGAFFTVNTAALLFAPQVLWPLAMVAACVLPFTLWSVWYQKFKVGSWCVLCLCTLALMWAQAALYLFGGAYAMPAVVNLTGAATLLAAYAVAVLALNRLMELLEERREGRELRRDYNRMRTSTEVVEAFEGKAPRFDTGTDRCTGLVFGAADAPHHITVFSNPYCGPCARMHSRIAHMPGHAVSVGYVMTYFSDDMSRINRYIIAAYLQLGAECTWRLLTEWYDGGKARGEEFFAGLGLDPDAEAVSEEMARHERWRDDDRLTGTPTVMIDGREIVAPYAVEDYMYIPA